MLARSGASLVELLVALALSAIVLASATGSALRQQRAERSVREQVHDDRQFRAMSMLLPGVLAGVSARAGDLAPGQATDTSLQLREPIAAGLACETAVGRAALARTASSDLALSGSAVAPRASDSLWWYRDRDSAWVGRRILATDAGGSCGAPVAGTSSLRGLSLDGADTIPAGAPLRVTRWVRYSIYRSGDGTWQLGMREWSDATGRYAPPQPVAGPYLLGPFDGARTGFRYFDATGVELSDAERTDAARIARVRLLALVRRAGTTGADSVRRESTDVALADGAR